MAKIKLGKVAITTEGKWNEGTPYNKLVWVTHEGSGYISRKPNQGVEPGTDESTWVIAADVKEFIEALKAALQEAGTELIDIKQTELAIAAAEAQRVIEEDKRKDAEQARKLQAEQLATLAGSLNTSEQQRAQAEQQRQEEEQKRIKQAQDTATAEAERNLQAIQQAEAEAEREKQEEQRQLNDEQREGKETARQQLFNTNEQQRQQQSQQATQNMEQALEGFTTEYNQDKQQRADDFNRQIQEQDQTFQNKEQQRDAAVEAVTNAAGRLNDIEKDLGKYPQIPDITLTAETAGSYINSQGQYVADPAWSVANIGAIVKGNKYELKMGSKDNMVLGAALFVSRTYTRNAEGQILRTTLTPLFSALSTDIPESGYVVFPDFDDYQEVLVSYRPAITSTLKVCRYGNDASMATQFSNLRKMVEDRTIYDGYYAQMRVGLADNLAGTGEGSMQTFHSRQTGGGNIMDGDAQIQSIQGQSLKFNQLCRELLKDNFSTNGGANFNYTIENGLVTASIIKKASNYYSSTIKYLKKIEAKIGDVLVFCCDFKANADTKNQVIAATQTEVISQVKYKKPGEWQKCYWLCKSVNTELHELQVYVGEFEAGETIQFKNICAYNLTAIFGEGNEPSTPEAFEAWLDEHFGQHEYFDYNEGSIIGFKGTAIKSKGTEETPFTSTRNFGEVLQKYFPGGMHRIGDVYDEITETRAIRRIEVLDLQNARFINGFGGFSTRPGNAKTSTKITYICSKYKSSSTRKDVDKVVSLVYSETEGYAYNGYFVFIDSSFNDAEDFKSSMKGHLLCYELAEPEIIEFDKPLNLTYKVAEGGTETLIPADEGQALTTEFNGRINYQKDYVKVVDTLQEQNQVTEIDIPNWEL